MEYADAIRPEEHAVFKSDRMGKSTIFRSDRILVGLNAFEPGQEHRLHAHEGMDKVYHVLEGKAFSCSRIARSQWNRVGCLSPRKAFSMGFGTPGMGG